MIDGVDITDEAVAQTIAAMRAGVDVIVQGALRGGSWAGRADILQRVEPPSDLGDWSYEAADTKLARETKGGTVLLEPAYRQEATVDQTIQRRPGYRAGRD